MCPLQPASFALAKRKRGAEGAPLLHPLAGLAAIRVVRTTVVLVGHAVMVAVAPRLVALVAIGDAVAVAVPAAGDVIPAVRAVLPAVVGPAIAGTVRHPAAPRPDVAAVV